MELTYVDDQVFEKGDFTQKPLPKGHYENCRFEQCVFTSSDLSQVQFSDCTFVNCDLSLTRLFKTAFREVTFSHCKMLGMHFEHCNPFGLAVSIEYSILNHSSFYEVKLENTVFKEVQCIETDFTGSQLAGAVFDNCNLAGAHFEQTILEKADLSTAYNYTIDPENNKIKKAKFSLQGLPGLLDKYELDIL